MASTNSDLARLVLAHRRMVYLVVVVVEKMVVGLVVGYVRIVMMMTELLLVFELGLEVLAVVLLVGILLLLTG